MASKDMGEEERARRLSRVGRRFSGLESDPCSYTAFVKGPIMLGFKS